jgi:thioredoxin reductase (NADPH)
LGIKGETEFSGMGVSYCATCDGAFFRGKTVAVIGGGDTALDDALYLSEICGKVYLVHRRNEFRGAARTVEKLRAKENVEFVLEAKPQEIRGTETVNSLLLEDGRSLTVDGVFVAVGMVPITAALADVVKLDEAGYVVAEENGLTSEPGFFVAGDVRTKALRQVITAVSDGANAATSAEGYIRTI